MGTLRLNLCCLTTLMLFIHVSTGQLSTIETNTLFQVQKLLEYPEALHGWTNWTSFCYLPPSPSLKILCSDNRVTELTVVGNKTHSPLSEQFSIKSLFTVLTKLPNLKLLSFVSLGLWGPLPPQISLLSSLRVLNLSSNFIYADIPSSISSITRLQSLVLSKNSINGSVPNLKSLVGLVELDLSSNEIGPKFPYFLFSMPNLEYINLAQNQLRGTLSNVSCSSKLRFTDISRNLLTGKLASCLGSNRTVVYSWNCVSIGNRKYQHPYSYCHKEALAVKPTRKGIEESSVGLGLILGLIGGGLVLVGVIGLLILAVFRRSQARRDRVGSVADKKSVHSSPKPITDARRAPTTMATIGLPPYHVFTLEEIEDATDNFDESNLVGEGSEGQVYKGWLSDGSVVQVRCIKLKQKQLPQHMETVSKLRHRHLVSVLGHCIVSYQDHPNVGGTTVFVLLENVSNGSLRDYLTDWRKKEKLKWPQRLSISISIARGVQFLHTGMAPGVFGNDLKIENVLLDESLTAKISGYNIPLTSKIGTESPLNILDASNNLASPDRAEKDDIYNLGAILVEVITGKPVTSESELNKLKLQLEKSLVDGVSKLQDLTDQCIRGTFAFQSLRTVMEITVNCLCTDPSKRPSIEDVLWNLQYAIQVQEGWTSSGNLSTQTY